MINNVFVKKGKLNALSLIREKIGPEKTLSLSGLSGFEKQFLQILLFLYLFE